VTRERFKKDKAKKIREFHFIQHLQGKWYSVKNVNNRIEYKLAVGRKINWGTAESVRGKGKGM
jgi:hypothetical protein